MISTSFKIHRCIALLLGLSLLALANCKRPDEPVNTIGTPVFAIKGSVNGQPLELTAGKAGYYMYTNYRYDSSLRLYSFLGTLKETACTVCNEQFILELYDSLNNTGTNPVNIDLVLSKNNYGYYTTKVENKIQYSFAAQDSGYINPRFLWDFGDSTPTVATKNPVHAYSGTLSRNVCLTIADNSTGCSKQVCNTIKPPLPQSPDSCFPDFQFVTDTLSPFVQFKNYSAFANYSWDFGDGNTSNAQSPSHTYNRNGTYQVCLTVITSVCNSQLCKTVVLNDTTFDCLANFSYKQPTTVVVTPSKNATAKLTYIDKNGEEYTSDKLPQPLGSYFTLLSHQPYKNNENGQKTRLLNARFKCRVYSTTTSSFKDLDIPAATVAIAYP